MRVATMILILLTLTACGGGANNSGSVDTDWEPGGELTETEIDAMRGEGASMAKVFRDASVDHYGDTGKPVNSLTGDGVVSAGELEGIYYRLQEDVRSFKRDTDDWGALVCEPIKDKRSGWGLLAFDYAKGGGKVKWYATEADLNVALNDLAK